MLFIYLGGSLEGNEVDHVGLMGQHVTRPWGAVGWHKGNSLDDVILN